MFQLERLEGGLIKVGIAGVQVTTAQSSEFKVRGQCFDPEPVLRSCGPQG